MKVLAVFLTLIAINCQAQKNLNTLINEYIRNQPDFSGVVLVAQKGKILFEDAYGLASRELNVPNTTETKFRIGSLTKQFTAAAILQLVGSGKLDLDDKLSEFFPSYPRGDSVTIHMLLTHTSGIKNYTAIPDFMSKATLAYPRDSVVAYFKDRPFDFAPGTGWNYSNSGYFLLGYIIEKVSGKSYHEYINENIALKAGLKNTLVDQPDSVLLNRAQGYYKTPNGYRNADYVSMEFPFSAGAIVTTIRDMYKWNTALFNGGIISPALLKSMTTPYKNKYGYGLGIDTTGARKKIGHTGGIPGFFCSASYFPVEDVYIAVFSNNFSPANKMVDEISGIVFEKK